MKHIIKTLQVIFSMATALLIKELASLNVGDTIIVGILILIIILLFERQ